MNNLLSCKCFPPSFPHSGSDHLLHIASWLWTVSVNAVTVCAGWINSQHLIFILLFKSQKLNIEFRYLQINMQTLSLCIENTPPSFTPKHTSHERTTGCVLSIVGLERYSDLYLFNFVLFFFLKQTLAFGDLREPRVLVYFEILSRVANLECLSERSDRSLAGYWSHLLAFSSSSGHRPDVSSARHSLRGT